MNYDLCHFALRSAETRPSYQLREKLFADNVDSSELAGILGIRLDLKGDLLTLGKSSVSVCNDSGEMYENIVSAIII